MNTETTELVNQLATKLGTTADHIWLVLTKEAPISAVENLGSMLIGSYLLYITGKYLTRWGMGKTRDMEEAEILILGILSIVWGICAAIMVFQLVSGISELATAFMNPEYYAFREIKGLLK